MTQHMLNYSKQAYVGLYKCFIIYHTSIDLMFLQLITKYSTNKQYKNKTNSYFSKI